MTLSADALAGLALLLSRPVRDAGEWLELARCGARARSCAWSRRSSAIISSATRAPLAGSPALAARLRSRPRGHAIQGYAVSDLNPARSLQEMMLALEPFWLSAAV